MSAEDKNILISNIFFGNNGSINTTTAPWAQDEKIILDQAQEASDFLDRLEQYSGTNSNTGGIPTYRCRRLTIEGREWMPIVSLRAIVGGIVAGKSPQHIYRNVGAYSFLTQHMPLTSFTSGMPGLVRLVQVAWMHFRFDYAGAQSESSFIASSLIGNMATYDEILNRVLWAASKASRIYDTFLLIDNIMSQLAPESTHLYVLNRTNGELSPGGRTIAKTLSMLQRKHKSQEAVTSLLKRNFPDANAEQVTKELSEIFAACSGSVTTMYELVKADNAEEVVTIFETNGTGSCMTKGTDFYELWHAKTGKPVHPAYVYHTPDVSVVAARNKRSGKLVSRAILNTRTNTIGKIYGQTEILMSLLAPTGAKQTTNSLENVKLATIPVTRRPVDLNQLQPRYYLGAYFDGPQTLFVDKDGTLTLTATKRANHGNPSYRHPFITPLPYTCDRHNIRLTPEVEIELYNKIRKLINTTPKSELTKALPPKAARMAHMTQADIPVALSCPLCEADNVIEMTHNATNDHITLYVSTTTHKYTGIPGPIVLSGPIALRTSENGTIPKPIHLYDISFISRKKKFPTENPTTSIIVEKESSSDNTSDKYALRIAEAYKPTHKTSSKERKNSNNDVYRVTRAAWQSLGQQHKSTSEIIEGIRNTHIPDKIYSGTKDDPRKTPPNLADVHEINGAKIHLGIRFIYRDATGAIKICYTFVHNMHSDSWIEQRNKIRSDLRYYTVQQAPEYISLWKMNSEDMHSKENNIIGMRHEPDGTWTPVYYRDATYLANSTPQWRSHLILLGRRYGVEPYLIDPTITTNEIADLFNAVPAGRYNMNGIKDLFYTEDSIVDAINDASRLTTAPMPAIFTKTISILGKNGEVHIAHVATNMSRSPQLINNLLNKYSS